jgi:ubiquinol-cytochrome c reductase cytochrome c subunit
LLLIFAFGLAAVIATAAHASNASSPLATSARTATAASTAPPKDKGRELFLRDCAWCHGDRAEGTSVAPPLQDLGKGEVDFELRTGRMPLAHSGEKPEPGEPAYDSATISALVGYVGKLGTGAEIPKVSPGDPAVGETLFVSHCAACHSSSGTGVVLTNGDRTPQLYDTLPTQAAEAIRMGPGNMPPFTDKQLTEDEMNDVVSYVQQLGPKQVKGGASLDQYGPILEGVLLWLLPLPLLVVVAMLLGKRRSK